MYRKTTLTLLLIALLATTGIVYAETQETPQLPSFLSDAISEPKVLVAVLIQFLLGLGLGYFSAKIAKYLVALIAIFILGSVLSVWSLGGSIEEFLSNLGYTAKELLDAIKEIVKIMGLLTIGPIAIGLIIGILAGLKG